jgi:hypothetical protein
MEALSENFKNHLDQIKLAIQNSEILSLFLEEESAEIYRQMIEVFEPPINELYDLVADNFPLQIVSLEKELLDPDFEGMFLPRILGYSVLRGEINDNYKYKMPQNHFRDILREICNSANFEFIKLRIGQTLQVGFALSSDIWITNLMEALTNKKVKSFLQQQKTDAVRDLNQRISLYQKYAKQFENHNYQTADFPSTRAELKVMGSSLIHFLEYRAQRRFNNESILPFLEKFLDNKDLQQDEIYLEIMMIVGMFYNVSDSAGKNIAKVIDGLRKSQPEFVNTFFNHLMNIYRSGIEITPEADKRMVKIINTKIEDGISQYYLLMNVVHTKGYVHEDTINKVREFYNAHEGLSLENECLRDGILGYCESFLNNLEPAEYPEYFEINKVFISYIHIFFNQKFNQNIKAISLKYIYKLLDHYTDKRGKDYQDIKKFVTSTFLDLGFMTEKELKSFFTTKK